MGALNCLKEEVSNAINKYMFTLRQLGYKSYCSTNKLLVFTFIEELLSKCNFIITEDDYNTMANAVNCLYGSCMIPFPNYVTDTTEIPIFHYDYFRITEDNQMRLSEDNNLRLIT